MKICPKGLVRVNEISYIPQNPVDSLVASERIYIQDFIRNRDGIAQRCNIFDATHLALQGGESGSEVLCERFENQN